ncbi:hypothetical protein CVT25_013593 [Psilocybe cyanescens]|uniref:Chitin synthase n=1 Tax=Psilocybe cyanescens TaxID=93625 RepID=A0A409WSX3_PSICY|nr:hypothetical protein CVT25_013593 [Psilocybe cyanescens]
MSNIVDKPLLLHILPGAFSAYRYIVLQNDAQGEALLEKYFLGETMRRRRLNGSFFAAVHSAVHFHWLYRSSLTFVRKVWIHVEMVYQLFNLIFSRFALVRFICLFILISMLLCSVSVSTMA